MTAHQHRVGYTIFRNEGEVPCILRAARIVAPDFADRAASVPMDAVRTTTVSPGASRFLRVEHVPTAERAYNAELQIFTNSFTQSKVRVGLRATGQLEDLLRGPATIDFGARSSSCGVQRTTFELNNAREAPLKLSEMRVVSGPGSSPSPFRLVDAPVTA